MVAPFPPLIYSAQPPLCRCRPLALVCQQHAQLMETTICSSSRTRVAAYCTPLERETSACAFGLVARGSCPLVLAPWHAKYYNATAVLLDNIYSLRAWRVGLDAAEYTSLHSKKDAVCTVIISESKWGSGRRAPRARYFTPLLHLVLSCTRE
jgi:hypothetical protein